MSSSSHRSVDSNDWLVNSFLLHRSHNKRKKEPDKVGSSDRTVRVCTNCYHSLDSCEFITVRTDLRKERSYPENKEPFVWVEPDSNGTNTTFQPNLRVCRCKTGTHRMLDKDCWKCFVEYNCHGYEPFLRRCSERVTRTDNAVDETNRLCGS